MQAVTLVSPAVSFPSPRRWSLLNRLVRKYGTCLETGARGPQLDRSVIQLKVGCVLNPGPVHIMLKTSYGALV